MPGDFVNNLVIEIQTLQHAMKGQIHTVITSQELREIEFLEEFTKKYITLIKK